MEGSLLVWNKNVPQGRTFCSSEGKSRPVCGDYVLFLWCWFLFGHARIDSRYWAFVNGEREGVVRVLLWVAILACSIASGREATCISFALYGSVLED